MLMSLLTVPFVVGKLGLLGYGSWEILLAMGGVTSLFQISWGGTLLWQISSAWGAEDGRQIRRLLRVGVGVTLLVFALTFPGVFLFRHPLAQVFHIPIGLLPTVELMLPIVIGLSVLGGITESLGAVLRGSQQAGFASLIQTVAAIANAAVLFGGLALGAGLWGMLAGYATASIMTTAGYYFQASRLYGWLDLRPALPTRNEVLSMRRYMALLGVGSISSLLRGETDKLVLAGFASPTWVAVYAIAVRMASLVMESNNFFYVPTIGAAGALNGRGDWAGVQRLYTTMTTFLPVAAGMVSVLVLSLYDRLVVVWLGRSVPGIAPILFLVVGGNVAAVMLTGPGTAVCRGIGKLETETTSVVAGLILNIVLTILLVWTWGAIGTVVASTVSWAAGAALFLVLLHRKLDLPVQGAYRSVGALLYLAAVVAGARLLFPVYASGSGRLPAFLSALKIGAVVGCVYLLPFIVANAKEFVSVARMLMARPIVTGELGE